MIPITTEEHVIRPYVRITQPARASFAALGFKLTRVFLSKIADNWLRLSVTWDTDTNGRDVASVIRGALYSPLGGIERQHLAYRFPYVKTPKGIPAIMEVGIETDHPNQICHRFRFDELFPYGIVLWFAPPSFDVTRGEAALFEWTPEIAKELTA